VLRFMRILLFSHSRARRIASSGTMWRGFLLSGPQNRKPPDASDRRHRSAPLPSLIRRSCVSLSGKGGP
jgi:hypothetical protein